MFVLNLKTTSYAAQLKDLINFDNKVARAAIDKFLKDFALENSLVITNRTTHYDPKKNYTVDENQIEFYPNGVLLCPNEAIAKQLIQELESKVQHYTDNAQRTVNINEPLLYSITQQVVPALPARINFSTAVGDFLKEFATKNNLAILHHDGEKLDLNAAHPTNPPQIHVYSPGFIVCSDKKTASKLRSAIAQGFGLSYLKRLEPEVSASAAAIAQAPRSSAPFRPTTPDIGTGANSATTTPASSPERPNSSSPTSASFTPTDQDPITGANSIGPSPASSPARELHSASTATTMTERIELFNSF